MLIKSIIIFLKWLVESLINLSTRKATNGIHKLQMFVNKTKKYFFKNTSVNSVLQLLCTKVNLEFNSKP